MRNAVYIFNSNDLQKLREDMHRALDLRFDEFQEKARLMEILPSSQKINWLKTEETLFIFFELLIEHKYIDCNWDFFRLHFIGDEIAPAKITFLQPTNQLPYIMDCLQKNGFLSHCKESHIRLAQHFLNRFSKPISNAVLRSSLNKSVAERTMQFIEGSIINKLKKHEHID